jgi:hypothetical protein
VNGLTCAQKGKEAVARLFPEALWIELVKPGFILANTVRTRMAEQKRKTGRVSSLIFLQNHGIFVGGQSLEEIETLYDSLMQKIASQLIRKPDFTPLKADASKVEVIKRDLGPLTSEPILFSWNKEFAHYLQDEGQDVISAFEQFTSEHGVSPKIVCVQNLGVFSLGEKPMPLFLDTVSIAVYTESFGGPRFMDDAMIDFIRNWEVEKYRSSVAAK